MSKAYKKTKVIIRLAKPPFNVKEEISISIKKSKNLLSFVVYIKTNNNYFYLKGNRPLSCSKDIFIPMVNKIRIISPTKPNHRNSENSLGCVYRLNK